MINLYSDTQTRPTDAMRAAMAAAEVGDEQRREDPTVIALEERVATLLGQEAAVFLPSGTMCNAIAVRLHIRPGGDETSSARWRIRCGFEAGGPAAISGAVLTVRSGEAGSSPPTRSRRPRRPLPPPIATRRARASSRSSSRSTSAAVASGRGQILEVLGVAAEHGLRSTSTARG